MNALLRFASLMLASTLAVVLSAQAPPSSNASPSSKEMGSTIPEEISVATREVPPFAHLNEEGQWEGISVDLLRSIKADLEAEADHEITLTFESMSLEEMLDAVEAGEVDLAVAAITVNHEREKRMDFSHTFYRSGLGIAVGSQQRRSGWKGIVDAVLSRTFLRIVAALLAAMLISAVGIYFFERRHKDGDFNHDWFRGIGSGLWWAAVTLTTVGYGDKVPKSIPGRLIGLIWMFAGLFIVASFTAAVASALTVNQLRTGIRGPSDLARVKVASVEGSTSSDYLRSRYFKFRSFEDVDSALESLQNGDCDAVVYDAPILRYVVFQELAGEVFVLEDTFEHQDYAFALQSNSPLREPINRSLLRQVSTPEWDDTLARYLGGTE